MTKVAVSRPRPRRTPGVVLGMGIGGLLDGILLHQILQWHSMGSAVVPPTTLAAMKQNMQWDGWFHALALLVTVIGVFLLLREATHNRQLPVARGLLGQMMLGWGAFNVVEGVADHIVLEIHHVHDLPTYDPAYDWLFFAVTLVILLVGWLLATRGDVAARSGLRATDLLVRPAVEP